MLSAVAARRRLYLYASWTGTSRQLNWNVDEVFRDSRGLDYRKHENGTYGVEAAVTAVLGVHLYNPFRIRVDVP